MNINDLSPELREKVKACTSTEELFALAKREGYKLSDEEMEAMSGGWKPCDSFDCPPPLDVDLGETEGALARGSILSCWLWNTSVSR